MDITIQLPKRFTRPNEYRVGEHWTTPGASGWWLIREKDGAAIQVIARPDLFETAALVEALIVKDAKDQRPDLIAIGTLIEALIEAPIVEAFDAHDRKRVEEASKLDEGSTP